MVFALLVTVLATVRQHANAQMNMAMPMSSLTPPQAEEQLLMQVIAAGPASEAPGPEPSLGRSYVEGFSNYYKLILHPAPGANPSNSGAKGIFEYWPLENGVVWKLTVFDFMGFTGAHLHRSSDGAIIVHLVPNYGSGDFINPTNYYDKTWNGYFGLEELSMNGIMSFTQFYDLIKSNGVYINLHGENKEADLTAYLMS